MRWWWVLGGLAVAVLWLVGETVAQNWLERRIVERVTEAAAGRVAVAADVDSFPVASRLATTGKVEHVEVRLEEVAGRGLGPVSVRFDVRGLALDRGALLSGALDVTGLEQGRFRAGLATSDLPTPVRRGLELFAGGAERLGLEVTRDGVTADLPLVGEVTATLPLRAPCDPDLEVEPAELVLRCTFSEVPEILARLAASRPVAPRPAAATPPARHRYPPTIATRS